MLDTFHQMSGLQISLHKSELYCYSITSVVQKQLAELIGIKEVCSMCDTWEYL